MAQPQRISASDARERLDAGQAVLVCAYDSRPKFEENHLEGAMSLDDLEARLPALDPDETIIFYCA